MGTLQYFAKFSLGGADIALVAMSAFLFAHMANCAMCAPPTEFFQDITE